MLISPAYGCSFSLHHFSLPILPLCLAPSAPSTYTPLLCHIMLWLSSETPSSVTLHEPHSGLHGSSCVGSVVAEESQATQGGWGEKVSGTVDFLLSKYFFLIQSTNQCKTLKVLSIKYHCLHFVCSIFISCRHPSGPE